MKYIVLDTETSISFETALGRSQVAGLEIPLMAQHPWIAVTFDGNQTQVWDSRQAVALWEYLSTGIVAGWNILDFDLPLIGNKVIQSGRIAPVQTLDLFDHARRRTKTDLNRNGVYYALEDVAQRNLGVGKLNVSANIPRIFQTDIELVINHCKQDVQLEFSLLQCALGEGMILPTHTDKIGITTPQWVLQI
jgi:hypothetical protein